MEMSSKTENKAMKNIVKGVLISLISTVIMLLIFAILLTYTNVNENITNTVIIVVTGISILIGSSIGNFKMKKNGLLNGAIIGGMYIFTIYMISSILNWRFSLNLQSIIMIVTGMIFGNRSKQEVIIIY